MISVLSLVVAILAVFFGPLIARANVQRQLQVAAREAWMREFREQVAAMLTSSQALGRRVLLLGRTARHKIAGGDEAGPRRLSV
jgi:hypothetical protein